MNVDTEKKITSILSSIRGNLIANFNDEEALLFIEWTNRKLNDTIKDRKEKVIFSQLKKCEKDDERKRLIKLKKKYLPDNYPIDLRIGDIVFVSYGFGYCSEISEGHYGIILSEFKANTYFVMPLGSEPLNIHPFYFDDLNLPNKTGIIDGKRSYLQFNQMGHIHYRRLENVRGCSRKNVGDDKLKKIFDEIAIFLNIDSFRR